MPCASTARCILVLGPLLYTPCPDCLPWHLLHAGARCNDWHRSNTPAATHLPHPFIAPAIEPPVRVLPVTINRRQISLGRPVRKIQNTPLIKHRLSSAIPPPQPVRANGVQSMPTPCLKCRAVGMLLSLHLSSWYAFKAII